MQSLLRVLRVALLAGLVLSLAPSCSTLDDDSMSVATTSGAALAPALQPAAATANTGDPCAASSECVSGNCVDAVCCATKCGGMCHACSAKKKQSGIDSGVCGPRKAGEAPKSGACQFLPSNECKAGTCNGAGSCGKPVGSPCGTARCQGNNTQFLQPSCGASGLCDAQTVTQCGTFLCDDLNLECLTACTGSEHCQPGHFCRGKQCVKQLDNGGSCSTNEQCSSGNCYRSVAKPDGICCTSDCSSPCNTCFKGEQEGPDKKDGECKPTRANDDPNEECAPNPDPCKGLGKCSGSGSCQSVSPNGTACGSKTGQCTVTGGVPSVSGEQCLGGSCSKGSVTTVCVGVSKCDAAGTGCLSNCAADTDCQSTHFCKAGSCWKRLDPGSPCSVPEECPADLCVDGYCCNADCGGACEACDLPGTEGMCERLSAGQLPHGDRDPCPSAGISDNPCNARVCDGITRATCEGYTGSETKCAEASCAQNPFSSSYSPERVCDGKGECSSPSESACGAAACANGCVESCTEATVDTDCVEHAKCGKSGCILIQACVNTEILGNGDGTVESCSPYACGNGKCLESCNSEEDCSGGALCDATTKSCVTRATATDPGDPGCGCRVPAPRSNAPWSLSLGLLGVAWLLRRRLA